jgi:DNA-binding response OmpR family regulator
VQIGAEQDSRIAVVQSYRSVSKGPTIMETILIVEDDQSTQKALKRLFESEGYAVQIRGDGKSALEAFHTAAPTAIILDLRLPVVSGKDVCREIRQQSSTQPIIVLSASAEEEDKVVLLELGADDYVTKPFSPREVLARVRTAIRHTRRSDIPATAEFGEVWVDFAKMEATFDDQPVRLTAHEFKMLKLFVQNAGRVISRGEILSEVFGYEGDPHTRTVDTHILRLRQKLEKDPNRPVHFRTLRGSGYKFVP